MHTAILIILRQSKRMKVVLAFAAIVHVSAGSPTTVEIAPGVAMPVVNHGSGNQTLWLEVGGRGMDTAWDYGDANQASVATALRSKLVSRSDVFVTTKVPCCPSTYYSYGEKRCADKSVNLGSAAAMIDATISRIGADKVDLLLMHFPCSKFEDSVAVYKVMEGYVTAGKVRAIGVSNFNASALDALVKSTSIKPALTQNPYSVGNHFKSYYGNDDETLNYCRKNNITLSAWGPLGGTTGVNVLHNSVVLELAWTHSKSAAQVALRFLVQRGIVPVTSGENPTHLRQDLDVFDFELSADEMARLEAVGAPHASTIFM